MKAIRRSIKGEKHDSKPHHISITPKSAIAIQPPKKVIKALYDYDSDPSNPQELGFHKGDFFHVISRENDENWYEACNPLIPSARGLVPVSYFEVIGKTERQSTGSAASAASTPQPDSGYSTAGSQGGVAPNRGHVRMSSASKGAMVYGIVQYDFNAERPDELEAKAGEAIIVIAQSNPEWFVAKPIGRLGGPGLIPVSFIEIRDMATGQPVHDPHKAVQSAGVPKVEEWKKLAADYKASSISLGKFDSTAGPPNGLQQGMERMSLGNGQQYANGNSAQSQGYNQGRSSQPQLLAPVSASIPRYCFENDKYWYIIECVLEDGSHWELSRFYQNFYDFQIKLLQQFPIEANTDGNGTRILPYMPGPVTYVTDAISNGRRESLNEYVKCLLALPPYISRCNLVRQLFAPREGDFELDPKAMQEDYRLSGGSQLSGSAANSQSLSRQSSHNQLNGSGYALSQQRSNPQRSYPTSQPYQNQQNPYNNQSNQAMHPMNRQPSSLTQNSTTSGKQPGGEETVAEAASRTGHLKMKIFFKDDCIAIRVPTDFTFRQLQDKLRDRLLLPDSFELMLRYKDEPTGGLVELISQRDFDFSQQRNTRLHIYVVD